MSPGGTTVVVLGYKNRGARANAVNRERVRAGLRTARKLEGLGEGRYGDRGEGQGEGQNRIQRPQPAGDHSEHTLLVLCGGSVASSIPESELMKRYARGDLGYSGPIVQDAESLTTWDNIRNALPHLEQSARIAIVSNPLHAQIGRAFLREQRPDLAERLVRGADYRFGESPHLRIPAAIVGTLGIRRLVNAPEMTGQWWGNRRRQTLRGVAAKGGHGDA